MPEQISKYPDVTIEVLREAGARCGEGVQQKILKKCPPKRFCALPTGEICVYGIADIPRMTQITTRELARIVCPREQVSLNESTALPIIAAVVIGAVFAIGLAVGWLWCKFKR